MRNTTRRGTDRRERRDRGHRRDEDDDCTTRREGVNSPLLLTCLSSSSLDLPPFRPFHAAIARSRPTPNKLSGDETPPTSVVPMLTGHGRRNLIRCAAPRSPSRLQQELRLVLSIATAIARLRVIMADTGPNNIAFHRELALSYALKHRGVQTLHKRRRPPPR